MSARAAVFWLLTHDLTLNGLGIDQNSVWPAQALDTAPRDRPFLILRWEETTPAFGAVGSTELTVWAHCPREISTDYAPLDLLLNRVAVILTTETHVEGEDGTFTCAVYRGKSPDLNDEGYKTITRNAAFTIVSR